MKKRLLNISKSYRDYKPINYSSQFFEYVDHFDYSRIILSLFVFIIYFSIAMDGGGIHSVASGINDLIILGGFFSFLIYSAVFNFARALFCLNHKVFPLYFGELDMANGFFKFDYLEWENKNKNRSAYWLTIAYDSVMFIGIVSLIMIVSYVVLLR